MRKSTKLVVLVAALVALFSLTAFAATQKGWIAEDGKWYFYDNNGDKVSNTFKQDQGRWFYLGEDCAMVTNSLVDWNDNLYYVGEDGARVTNTWVKLAADSDDETGAEYRYYYAAGSDGKIFRASDSGNTKKINGKTYAFDDDGKMLFGYVQNKQMINNEVDPVLLCDHYFGAWNDGAMVTGWYEYKDGFVDYNAEKAWFYFKSNGEKVVSDGYRLINKKYYAFDEKGVMQTGWYASDSEVTKYYEASGALKKSGWVRTTTDIVTDESWFYLSEGSAKKGAVLVKKKWYALKETGAMASGLVALEAPIAAGVAIKEAGLAGKTAAELKAGGYTNLYFFSDDAVNDGSAKTGSIKIDLADAEYTFGFDKHTYKALDEADIASTKYVYDTGMLQLPGASYGVVKSHGHEYFVDSTGKLVTKTGKYGVDGKYYVVDGLKEGTNKVKYTVADGEYFYRYYSGTTLKDKWVNSASMASDLLKVVNDKMSVEVFNFHYPNNQIPEE